MFVLWSLRRGSVSTSASSVLILAQENRSGGLRDSCYLPTVRLAHLKINTRPILFYSIAEFLQAGYRTAGA